MIMFEASAKPLYLYKSYSKKMITSYVYYICILEGRRVWMTSKVAIASQP